MRTNEIRNYGRFGIFFVSVIVAFFEFRHGGMLARHTIQSFLSQAIGFDETDTLRHHGWNSWSLDRCHFLQIPLSKNKKFPFKNSQKNSAYFPPKNVFRTNTTKFERKNSGIFFFEKYWSFHESRAYDLTSRFVSHGITDVGDTRNGNGCRTSSVANSPTGTALSSHAGERHGLLTDTANILPQIHFLQEIVLSTIQSFA
jgi:hypothetical protein